MGGFLSALAPSPSPMVPAPAPAPAPDPVDSEQAARDARIKALIRRRRGLAGLAVSGDRGVLDTPADGGQTATKLGG